MTPSPEQKFQALVLAHSKSGFLMVLCLLQFMDIKAATNAADNHAPAVRGEASLNSMHETVELDKIQDTKLNAARVAVSVDHAGHAQTVQKSASNERTIRDENHHDHETAPRRVKKARMAVPAVLEAEKQEVRTAEKLGPIDGATPVRPNSTSTVSTGSSLPGGDLSMLLTPIVAFCIYTAGIVVMIGVTVGIYSERGFSAVLIILTYILSLSSMTLTIRNLFVSTPFDFPRWVSASHFLCTFLVGFVILLCQQAKDAAPIAMLSPKQFLSSILPVAIALASSIGFANLGLLHANAHFYEMVGATTPLATVGLHVVLGKAFSVRLLPPCLLIAFGLAVCAYYEVAFSWTGFAFCVTAVLCRAIKSLIQNVLMQNEADRIQLEPLELLVWTSLPCGLVMASWSLVQEGTEPYSMVFQSKETALALLYTILNACFLNTSALYVLHDLGPLAQQIAVQLKGVLAILGSVWLFNETTLINQIGGYMCMVIGIYWYNRKEYVIKMHQPPDPRDGQAPRAG